MLVNFRKRNIVLYEILQQNFICFQNENNEKKI
jgi:hypothetical protein